MNDYTKMSRAELIARLHALESRGSCPVAGHGDSPALAAQRLAKGGTGRKWRKGRAADSAEGCRDTEERLRAIMQTAVEGIVTIDEHGLVESINPAAEKIFGFSASELIGRNVGLLMPSPYREEHDSYMARYLRTGQAKIIGIGREVVGQRKDGTVFPMDLAVSEVKLADRRLFTGFIRDITERRRLEQEILEISDQERRRIGQDLHDGLCQHLAGIELKSQVLEQKLARKSKRDAAGAGEIARHVRDAISQTRSLARGLSPVTLESEGLASALEELGAGTEKLFGIVCRVECPRRVLVEPMSVATHLYRIAQEAVSNAIKHGKATEVRIRLENSGDRTLLRVADNGRGFAQLPPRQSGMGLRIMKYRAGMIGADLRLENLAAGGGVVVCSLPNRRRSTQTTRR